MPTLVKFRDFEDGICYGIKIEDIIYCSCCGGTFELDEIETLLEEKPWQDLGIEQLF